VVIDANFTIGSKYDAQGTPMAVLVDAEGNVASGVAAGAQQVWALVQDRTKNNGNNEPKANNEQKANKKKDSKGKERRT